MNTLKDDTFYKNIAPIKITEARKLKLHAESWGLLTEYYLESVKISNFKGKITSTATLRIGDRAGQVTCVLKGPSIGLLFGQTPEQWTEIQELCDSRDQLFYRFFKNGINRSFSVEQQIFYNFCLTNQKHEVLVARFRRCVNTRNRFKNDALLEVLQLKKCDYSLMDLYIDKLKTKTLPPP